jgi:cell division protease FtsH
VKDRVAILRVHARGKPLASGVELEQVARQTTGFSGADLENVMNEAALLSARRGCESIGVAELEEAVDRVVMGLARTSQVVSEREKWITAYHEAGHALAAQRMPSLGPVQRITIIPRGNAGGHTRLLPVEDRHLWSRSQLSDAIVLAMGGMAAEELVFGDMTTASANDLAEATGIARKMVCLFGMGRETGPISLGGVGEVPWAQGLSEQTAGQADAETRDLLQRGRDRALEILRSERARLERLAGRLVEQETLQGEELEALLSESNQGRVSSPPLQSERIAEKVTTPI